MEPLADLTIPTEAPKPVTPLPWSDEPLAIDSREPEVSEHAPPDDAVELPKHEKIGFKILPWRVRLYGGTLGCKACEETDISDKTPGGYYRRHTPKCRARFEELVKAEGAHNIRKVDTPEEIPPELDTEEIPADEEDLEDPPLDDEDSTILDDILFGSPTEEDLRAEEELPESADLADELGLHDPPIPTPSSSSSGAWKKGEPWWEPRPEDVSSKPSVELLLCRDGLEKGKQLGHYVRNLNLILTYLLFLRCLS